MRRPTHPRSLAPSHAPNLTTPSALRAPTRADAMHCNVDENVLRKTADAFVATGLAKLGYTYVNVDERVRMNGAPAACAPRADPNR